MTGRSDERSRPGLAGPGRTGSLRATAYYACALFVVFVVGCGSANEGPESATIRAAVIDGTRETPGRFPDVGAIVEESDAGPPGLVCTAVLIDPSIVVTAAHCFALKVGASLAFVPSSSINDGAARDRIPIEASSLHPEFVVHPSNGDAPIHDVALGLLARAVDGSQAAPFPFAKPVGPTPGQTLLLVGYGPMNDATGPGGVQNEAASIVDRVNESEFTVPASPRPQPCFGDSGGPAYAADGKTLLGLASRAAVESDTSCLDGAIYTRIDAHSAWLESAVAALGPRPEEQGGTCSTGRPGNRRPTAPNAMALLVALAAFAIRRGTVSPSARRVMLESPSTR